MDFIVNILHGRVTDAFVENILSLFLSPRPLSYTLSLKSNCLLHLGKTRQIIVDVGQRVQIY